ncbi:MAG TPA: MarR family transcriptional regulator [Porticoccus sp.]|nr:MarR family transcriptional regulator [Porticoccus sp.]
MTDSSKTSNFNLSENTAMPSAVDLLPYLMNRLTSKINQLWLKELRPYGLTISRWQVLSILTVMDGCRVGELAEMAGAEQAVISRVVDQMQRDGLVQRKPAQADSRAIEVWISSKGRKLFQQLLPQAASHVDRLVSSLPEGEASQLANGLERMLEDISGPE